MTQSKQPVLIHGNRCSLLYDAKLLDKPQASFLSRDIFEQAMSCHQITQGGRGQAWFIELTNQSTVLRSYQRGGFVAKFNQQTYFGWSAEGSRAFKRISLIKSATGNRLARASPNSRLILPLAAHSYSSVPRTYFITTYPQCADPGSPVS